MSPIGMQRAGGGGGGGAFVIFLGAPTVGVVFALPASFLKILDT
jgi:hypothetical protein